jgi:hypothetical protein
LGVGWNAAGGVGAAREGCIELCFGGDCGSILGKQTMPASWLLDGNELVDDRDRRQEPWWWILRFELVLLAIPIGT